MCVFNGPADANSTIVSLTRVTHPEMDRAVHVLGYKNTVKNRDDCPNFMILPFPSKHPLGRENVIDTSHAPDILDSMVTVVSKNVDENGREMISRSSLGTLGVTMFSTGIYTVIVGDPRHIHAVIRLLPSDVRPDLQPKKMEWYAKMYPGWQIALCCFNNRRLADATPMLWWYAPMDESTFFVPMLDQHDGNLPNLTGQVGRDHWIICGDDIDYEEIGAGGVRKTWADNADYRYYRSRALQPLRWALPKRIIGFQRRGVEDNRDYRVKVGVVNPQESNSLEYVLPPGFGA